MSKSIVSEEGVQAFLDTVINLTDDSKNTGINSKEWVGKVNKTREFMAETGLKLKDVISIIRELKVCHYSYTDDDYNPRFTNEKVWIFGMTKNIVDVNEKLYIKLKIRDIKGKKLLIMSFHREQPGGKEEELRFPYKNQKVR